MRELRKKKGLTQDEAAKLLCVSKSTLRNWEKGRIKPPEIALDPIAKVYGVAVGDVLQAIKEFVTKKD